MKRKCEQRKRRDTITRSIQPMTEYQTKKKNWL